MTDPYDKPEVREDTSRRGNPVESDQGETEDEEVKRNCIMGLSALRESDFSDTEDENEDEVELEDEPEEKNVMEKEQEPETLVRFVTPGQMVSKAKGVFLYRPTPIAAKLPTHHEDSNEDEDEDNNVSVQSDSRSPNDTENPSMATASNDDINPANSDGDSDEEEGDGYDHVESTTVPASSRQQQEDQNGDKIYDDSDSGSEAGQESEQDDEADYAAIMLAMDEPTTISEDHDKPMVQDHVEPEEEDYALIGASVDDKWTWTKQKRVLSSNTLAALNREAGRNADSPKRVRSIGQPNIPQEMPELSLGMAVGLEQTKLMPRQGVNRDDSPLLSTDDEEDRMLSEELEEKMRDAGGDSSPIPLLTPPQSPRREDEVEWPSNLVIDSALMNTVNDLRPLSPASLQDMEEDEECGLGSHDIEASTMTPLLQSIYVGST